MKFGEFVEQRSGSGMGGEDAADGGEREAPKRTARSRAAARRPRAYVAARASRCWACRLALDLLGEQAVEERHATGPRSAKRCRNSRVSFSRDRRSDDGSIDCRRPCACAARARWRAISSDPTIDDHFAVVDADRQHLADVRPRHRVVVQPLREEAFDIDMAIDDERRVEVAGRQRQQVRSFALVAVARRFLEVTHHMHIGDGRQPLGRDFVEMVERVEGAAVEQTDFDVVEFPLDFALRLRAVAPAGRGRKP